MADPQQQSDVDWSTFRPEGGFPAPPPVLPQHGVGRGAYTSPALGYSAIDQPAPSPQAVAASQAAAARGEAGVTKPLPAQAAPPDGVDWSTFQPSEPGGAQEAVPGQMTGQQMGQIMPRAVEGGWEREKQYLGAQAQAWMKGDFGLGEPEPTFNEKTGQYEFPMGGPTVKSVGDVLSALGHGDFVGAAREAVMQNLDQFPDYVRNLVEGKKIPESFGAAAVDAFNIYQSTRGIPGVPGTTAERPLTPPLPAERPTLGTLKVSAAEVARAVAKAKSFREFAFDKLADWLENAPTNEAPSQGAQAIRTHYGNNIPESDAPIEADLYKRIKTVDPTLTDRQVRGIGQDIEQQRAAKEAQARAAAPIGQREAAQEAAPPVQEPAPEEGPVTDIGREAAEGRAREQAAAEERRQAYEAGRRGTIFVSPNTGENMTFENAQAALGTDEQAALRGHAQDVMDEVSGGGSTRDAIGDWSDGAENSLVVQPSTLDPEQVRYVAAKLGDAANQKAVIHFVPGEGGDSLWHFVTDHDAATVRSDLDRLGVKYRTLVPEGANRTRVFVFDPGTELRDTMEKVGDHYDQQIGRDRGTGEFLGGDTREEGHAAYQGVIEPYEQTHEPYRGHYGEAQGRGPVVHHNGGTHTPQLQEEEVSPGTPAAQPTPTPAETQPTGPAQKFPSKPLERKDYPSRDQVAQAHGYEDEADVYKDENLGEAGGRDWFDRYYAGLDRIRQAAAGTVTDTDVERLLKLGYDQPTIDKMSVAESRRIILQGERAPAEETPSGIPEKQQSISDFVDENIPKGGEGGAPDVNASVKARAEQLAGHGDMDEAVKLVQENTPEEGGIAKIRRALSGADNTGTTIEEYEAAKKSFNEKTGGSSNIGPGFLTALPEAYTMAKFEFERLARAGMATFDHFASAMEQYGDAMKPHINDLWDALSKQYLSGKQTKGGLAPEMRTLAPVDPDTLPSKAPIATGDVANPQGQLDNIDTILRQHPNATNSVDEWNTMMAHALADNDVPVPPYNAIKMLNNDGLYDQLSQQSPGQIANRRHGMANGDEFRELYRTGKMQPTDTAKVFGWSILSRTMSPYAQEGLFIDAFHGMEPFIEKAAKGQFTEADLPAYTEWAETTAPKGSGQPGSAAIHNLHAFGETFLMKMGVPDADGVTPLQKLHNMMADDNMTGPQIRREFYKMNISAGIDNKVVSFSLLVTGRSDLLVLDRVQVGNFWDDGRFAGKNLYDGQKRYNITDLEGNTKTFYDPDEAEAHLRDLKDQQVDAAMTKAGFPDPEHRKAILKALPELKVKSETIPGTGLAEMTTGSQGLLIYEALERGIAEQLPQVYARLGRSGDASLGGYHWDSWVVKSGQEAGHATIESILRSARGEPNPLAGVYAREGQYNKFAYSAEYGRDAAGPHFMYSDSKGVPYRFSVDNFRQFLDNIKKPSSGVVPAKFGVTEVKNEPWFNRPEVNRDALDQQVHQYGTAASASPAGIQEPAAGAVPYGTGRAGRPGVAETAGNSPRGTPVLEPGATAPLKKARRARALVAQ